MRPVAKLYDHALSPNGQVAAPNNPQGFKHPPWYSHILPRKETRRMSDPEVRNGLFLPYPLLGIITTVAIVVIGGLIGLFVQINSLQTTMLIRDADHRQQLQQAWQKIEQQAVYIQNDRERIVKLEAKIERQTP